MREKFWLSVTLAGAFAIAGCASEDLPPYYLGSLYDAGSSAVGSLATGGSAAGNSTIASSSGGTGGSGLSGAAGPSPQQSSAGGSGAGLFGGGGAQESVDSGNPCPTSRPENGSSCIDDGLRCSYRRYDCECRTGAWNCND